jgi:hypothetical protein
MSERFIVANRVFEKPFNQLYIGSSVVAGNIESVRDQETKAKGQPLPVPTYLPLDNLELVEVYKGFQVHSNVDAKIVYEILYDALEEKVKGILAGIQEEEGGVGYYSFITPSVKSIKRKITFYIDYDIDFGLLPAIEKEIKEIFELTEEQIKERYGNPNERIYAGSFIASTKDCLVLIPFATYKPNEVIPAYTGEEDERIPQLESQIEEINQQLAQIEDTESEEYKKLSEQRKELIRELAKIRNKLYNPDIVKSVKTKGERFFITQKPEIRYLGENLLAAAVEYKTLKLINPDKRIKGIYAVVGLPTYNNLSKQIQRSTVELMLCLYDEGEMFPLEVQKARHSLAVMDEVLKELIKALEAGTKPTLNPIKEKVKDNLSLKKRIEDLEKFIITKLDNPPEELELLKQQLETYKKEIEQGRKLLYSPFTINKLITPYEVISLLQEARIDVANLTKENWNEFYTAYETLNETLENILNRDFGNEIQTLVKFFLKHIKEGKPIRYRIKTKEGVIEGYYPEENRALEVVDLIANRTLINIIKGILRKLNAYEKVSKALDLEFFFEGVSVRLGYLAITAFVRKVFVSVAKNYLREIDFNRKEEIKQLKEFLIANWLGEYKKSEGRKTVMEDNIEIEVDGLEDILAEED